MLQSCAVYIQMRVNTFYPGNNVNIGNIWGASHQTNIWAQVTTDVPPTLVIAKLILSYPLSTFVLSCLRMIISIPKKQKHAHCENLHTSTEQEQNIGPPWCMWWKKYIRRVGPLKLCKNYFCLFSIVKLSASWTWTEKKQVKIYFIIIQQQWTKWCILTPN